ncbi:baseplate multidomain protein megatron, partial [Methylobacterium brachythecii]
MATLILGTVGGVVGTALGGPIGSAVGKVLGAAGGSLIDGALFGGGTRYVEGPRLSDVAGLTSTEGEPIPRVYGRARLGGTLIWATRPLEVANTSTQRSSSGAKGSGQKTVTTSYAYFANIAVGICAGEIAFIRRVWADGSELDLTTLTMRVHTGRADQEPDPLIVAKEGAARTPAYRGLAYVVFERLALADFGNRIPQLAFEVIRPVDGIARHIRAVCLIPGATEFGLDPTPVSVDADFGTTRPANRFQLPHASDVVASLDALQALCPNLKRVSVVVSWFGSDLRAGHCDIAPRIDSLTKKTTGDSWSVADLTRLTADRVSLVDGNPAYGGTPSDAGLVRLVAELTRRGLGVVLYPFVMMDVPADNALPDPYRPGESQPAYPWRGRIACDPAPGLPGSPDGTAEAAIQVTAFFEGHRRLVLHYASLLRDSGLAGLIIGSELPGLTRLRGADGGYPAVEALRVLAGEARAILGPSVKLVYAADWTEYGAHVRDGGATIRFPLDALFADPAIDAVGIDYYPPLSDWRDGDGQADAALSPTIYDRAYLKSRLGAGEAFDWFYASDADRIAQTRTPITDGAYQKPWIYRAKDLVAWWSNPHIERDGGVETLTTAWLPGSKPIWLTEIGVAAVDRSTNGPNAFPDPKSSENALPPFSRGIRDELIQVRGLEAILSRFDPAVSGFEPAHNPIFSEGGLRMVDPDGIFVWCWDARPFPAFPAFDTVWSDADNWALGHWITGRSEGQELDRLIAFILAAFGIAAPTTIAADGFVDGFVIDRPLSARGVLEGLCQLFGLDVSVAAGRLLIRGPQASQPVALLAADLVEPGDGSAPLSSVRAEDGALPRTLEVGFSDGESDEYRRATAAALRPGGTRRRESRIEASIVSRRGAAQSLAEGALDAALAARETASFSVSPRRLDLKPGDRLILPDGSLHRITRISDSPVGRAVETAGAPVMTADGGSAAASETRSRAGPPSLPSPPFAVALDLPVTRGDPVPLQYLAVA